MRARHVVWLLGVLLACGVAMQIGAPLRPETTILVTGPVSLALPLADGALLVDDGTGLEIRGESGAEPLVLGPSGEVGSPIAFASFDGTTLVSGSAGTFVVRAEGISRAPLDSALAEGEAVVQLTSSAREGQPSDLWVSTDRALRVFREGNLVEVRVSDTLLAAARLAPAGAGAIWAATDSRVIRITVESDELAFTARALERPAGADAIAADADGVLWLVNDGTLSALRAGDRLVSYAIPLEAEDVYASPEARDVWIRGADGALFHELDRIFRPVDDVIADDAFLGLDGALVTRSDDGVTRLRARHALALEGLHEGPLVQTTEVSVLLPAQEHATAVRADVDGVVLPVRGTPPTFSITPGVVGLGVRTLHVAADYDDGTLTATLARSIDVQSSVTYAGDIQPLYASFCGGCHGPTGGTTGGSTTRLDSREPWMRLSSLILEYVRSGRMPRGLPRLTPESIALIQTWVDNGYPE